MDGRVQKSLEELRPKIKKRWDALLRAQPAASPLASPDTLVYLMNETLDQLGAAARSRSLKTWLRRNPALLTPLRARCECGINPLLAYYSTGQLALREVARPVLGAAFEEVSVYYHALAQQDIEALCGLCRNKGPGHCSQAQIAREPAVACASSGR